MTDIKPCPFCGEPENLTREELYDESTCIDCEVCAAAGPTEGGYTWDDRPSPWKFWSEEKPEEDVPILLIRPGGGAFVGRHELESFYVDVGDGSVCVPVGRRRLPLCQWVYLSEVLP